MNFDVDACFAGVSEIRAGSYTEYMSGVYRLHYVIDGQILLKTPTGVRPLLPQTLYLMPPTLSYSLVFGEECTFYKRLFFTFLPKRPIVCKDVQAFDCPLHSALRHQVETAIAYLETGDANADTEQALLCLILRLAHEQSEVPYLTHPGIERALLRIHDAYAARLTVEELSLLADMEKTAFIRAFHRITARTPMRYLKEYRTRAALRMMMEGMSATSASHCAGFPSPSAFSLACKELYGVPPTSFLHSLRTSISRKDMII